MNDEGYQSKANEENNMTKTKSIQEKNLLL